MLINIMLVYFHVFISQQTLFGNTIQGEISKEFVIET